MIYSDCRGLSLMCHVTMLPARFGVLQNTIWFLHVVWEIVMWKFLICKTMNIKLKVYFSCVRATVSETVHMTHTYTLIVLFFVIFVILISQLHIFKWFKGSSWFPNADGIVESSQFTVQHGLSRKYGKCLMSKSK